MKFVALFTIIGRLFHANFGPRPLRTPPTPQKGLNSLSVHFPKDNLVLHYPRDSCEYLGAGGAGPEWAVASCEELATTHFVSEGMFFSQ